MAAAKKPARKAAPKKTVKRKPAANPTGAAEALYHQGDLTTGFAKLRADIALAAAEPGTRTDRIVHIGSCYVRFAAQNGALSRAMFGQGLPNREAFPDLEANAAAIGEDIGMALGDQALGLAVWSTAHGLAMLILENMIDLGQRQSGLGVIPSRAEILLRSLFGFADR